MLVGAAALLLWVAFRVQWRRRVHYHTLWGGVLPPERVHESLRETLREFARVATAAGLDWWLDGGTLLGAWRTGGFIPWDDDVDVGILHSSHARLEELAGEFRAPFRLVRVSRLWSLDKVVPGLARLAASPTFLRLLDTRTQLYVDIMHFADDAELRLLPLSLMHPHPTYTHRPFAVAREVVFPLGSLAFEGASYPAPAEPVRYLRRMYGEDLRPDR